MSGPLFVAGRAQIGFDRLDREVLPNLVHHVVRVPALGEPKPINHRLEAIAAQHLLLHGRDTLGQVFSDN